MSLKKFASHIRHPSHDTAIVSQFHNLTNGFLKLLNSLWYEYELLRT